jgi:hypothetical protein
MNTQEFKNYVKSQINNEYTVIDFLELDAEREIERKGIIIHEDIEGDTFTSIGYYDSANNGLLASTKVLKYNGEGWNTENEKVITGFYIIDVINCSHAELNELKSNNWGDDVVTAANSTRVFEL